MSLPYKYTTSFDNIIIASSQIEDSNISRASLESLRPLIPSSIDLDKNIDLVGVAFNAAVVNKFNKNGDGIDSETAVAVKDYFVHKPTNIEHDRDRIVGHIVSAGFSRYGSTSDLMTDDEALIEDNPYNIALAAVVYRTASKEFADLVENSTDQSGDYYNTVSASWEVGFNDYVIAVGGDDLHESSLISDPQEIEAYTPYLKSFGGKGTLKDGRKVNRLIIGDIYPLGIGFTSNPAADVKGLITQTGSPKPVESSRNEPIDKIIINNQKTSHSSQENVLNKEPNNKIMDKDQIINEFRAALDEKLGKQDFSEESVASISKVFIEAIREKSEQYLSDLEKTKAEKEEAVQAQNSLQEKMLEVEEQLNSTKEQLTALEQENSAREAEVRFNSRMEALNEVYELDDEDRKILAADLSDLDETEDSFANYQEKLSKVWKHKNKETIAAEQKAFEDRVAQEVAKRLEAVESTTEASEEVSTETPEVAEVAEASQTEQEDSSDEVEEALDSLQVEEAAIVNNNESSSEGESLRDRFAKTFKESVKISY
jgi:hypothetical protein